jgi:hypothetical protein
MIGPARRRRARSKTWACSSGPGVGLGSEAQITAVGSPVAWLGRATALRLARRAAARSSASIASAGDSPSADIGVHPRHRARVRIGAVEASDGDVELLPAFGRSTPSCAWVGRRSRRARSRCAHLELAHSTDVVDANRAATVDPCSVRTRRFLYTKGGNGGRWRVTRPLRRNDALRPRRQDGHHRADRRLVASPRTGRADRPPRTNLGTASPRDA